jgi:hypothetical protein
MVGPIEGLHETSIALDDELYRRGLQVRQRDLLLTRTATPPGQNAEGQTKC